MRLSLRVFALEVKGRGWVGRAEALIITESMDVHKIAAFDLFMMWYYSNHNDK